MNRTQTPPPPEALTTFSRILDQLARHHHLRHDEAEDFIQSVHVRLIERDYDIFRSFAGRSSLRTYLIVVATRLLLDWRNERYGKWRASAAAQRHGAPAIMLERLLHRDGYDREAAIETVRQHYPSVASDDLRDLAPGLPARRRPVMVAEEHCHELPAPDAGDPVEATERRHSARRVSATLARVLRSLPADEQFLIRGRFLKGRSMRALAQSSGTDTALIYRHCESILRRLRKAMLAAGVTGTDVLQAAGAFGTGETVRRPARRNEGA